MITKVSRGRSGILRFRFEKRRGNYSLSFEMLVRISVSASAFFSIL